MKNKLCKLLALMLTLAMVLPMVMPAAQVLAEEITAELPTETVPAAPSVNTDGLYERTDVYDFQEASQADAFSFYQSAADTLSVADGILKPTGATGELKAVLKQTPANIKSVSVDLIPGQSGTINAGLVIGVSNASNNVDGLVGMLFLVTSNFTGWEDAPNRIDIIQGCHNNNYQELSRMISETPRDNALFSKGVKEPVNLKLDFGDGIILLTLSLVSDPTKSVQQIYEVDNSVIQGQVGLRQYYADTCFDNLTVEYLSEESGNYRTWEFTDSAHEITSYQSGEAGLSLKDGMLTPEADRGEMQAVFDQDMSLMDSVSVDLIPGASGRVDADVIVGVAKDNASAKTTKAIAADPLAEHLVAHYTFDDANDLGKDSSGNGKNATAEGAMSGVSGVRGGAASFNGSGGKNDAYLSVPAEITHSENITLMTWVKFDRNTLKSWAKIFEFQNGSKYLYLFARNGNSWEGYRGMFSWAEGKTELATGGARSVNGTNIPDIGNTAYLGNQWHHVAMVMDDTTMYLYINGHVAATAKHTGNPAQLAATKGRIGASIGWNDASFIGIMDDFRVYDKALTPEEIASVNGFAPEDFLIFDLEFDNASQPVADSSGYNAWTNVESGTLDVVDGKNGTGVYLDGTDAIRIERDLLYGSQGATISTWVKYDEMPAAWSYLYDFALDSQNSTYLAMSMAGHGAGPSVIANVGDGTGEIAVRNATAVTTGEWIHVATTIEAGSTCIYMNGILVAKSEDISFDAADLAWTNYNYIGRGNWNPNDPWFKGYLDEFRIYSRVLSADEVKEIAGLAEEEPADAPIANRGLTFGVDVSGDVVSGQYASGWTELDRKSGFAGGITEPVNMKLSFGEDTVTVTLTKISDPTQTVQYTYCVELGQLQGKVGLRVADSDTCFDNLRVDYKDHVRVWDFTQSAQEFSFYKSASAGFGLENGMLTPAAADKDIKAILEQNMADMKSVSINMIPGESGLLNGSLIFGVSDEGKGVDDFIGMGFNIDSTFTGWDDAPNRLDIIQGAYNHNYKELSRHVTENLKGNGLFSNGVKEPVTLKLEFGENTVDATLSLVSDPSKFVQYTYAVDAAYLQGKIGVRLYDADTRFDNLVITYKENATEETPVETITYLNEGYNFYKSSDKRWELSAPIYEAPLTMEAWVRMPEGISGSKESIIVTNRYGTERGSGASDYAELKIGMFGNPQFSWCQEGGSADTFVADVDVRTGKWTHIAYTYDVAADTVICYVNGQVVSTWENAGLEPLVFNATVTPFNAFTIGSMKSFDSNPITDKFAGWIADVRLWNKTLNQAEIIDSMMTQYTTAKDGLVFNAPLNELVDGHFVDLSGSQMAVKQYAKAEQWVEDTSEPGAYSMIVIPDQQILNTSHPEKLNQLYQWIADNREKENIQIVMSVGDNVDHNGNVTEWANARAALEILPDDLPFITAPGNHDYDTYSGYTSGYGKRDQLTLINEHFPVSMFAGYPTESGFFDENNCVNQWQAFAVNGNKYLIIALEYVPQDDVLAWANDVVASHADHQVIMITHRYLSYTVNREGISGAEHDPAYNEPIQMWDKFVSQHENIIMTINGHESNEYIGRRVDKGINGNDVIQMLMDAQNVDRDNGGKGLLGILRFNADGTVCNVSYYSPIEDKCLNASNQFTLNLPAQEKNYVAQVGEIAYTTVTEAIANANGNVVTLLANSEEEIVINSDVTIDLAGHNLTNVTVENGSLKLIDTVSGGSAVVNGNVPAMTEADGKSYYVSNENGVYSAHSYAVKLTHISLDPTNDALGYKAELIGDDVVKSHVKSIGFNLWVSEDMVVTKTIDGKTAATLRLKNILKNNGGEMTVYGNAFVIFDNEQTITSADYGTTMKVVLQTVDAAWASFTDVQREAVMALCEQYIRVVSGWNLSNIYPVAEAA